MAIEGVIYEPQFDSHENSARTVVSLIRGKLDFSIGQVRTIYVKVQETLGNHWREYPEIYGLIGDAKIVLEDIETREKKRFDFKTGDRMFIPSRVALKILASPGTVITVCSPEGFREEQTHKYQVID